MFCIACFENPSSENPHFAELLLPFLSFAMAIVDLNYVQFWQPSLNPRPSKQRDSVSHARKNAESSLTIISCKQQALLDYEEIGEGDKQRNLAVAIAQHQQQRFTTAKEDNLNRNQGTMQGIWKRTWLI